MRIRTLGRTGIRVSEIGFGTWGIGGDAQGTMAYGPTDDAESLLALAEARARGCTFFDTSNLYGWGHAEELLARALRGHRQDVVIATKAGYVTPDGAQDFSPHGVRASLEQSLRRLETDYVDVLQLHNPEPELLDGNVPLFDELERMRRDGQVRAIGISARTPDEALGYAAQHRPDVLQVNFNLGDLRALRNGLFELCAERGIGVIVRSPLAAGFLTGGLATTDSFVASDHRSRYDTDVRARWIDAADRLGAVFTDVQATPAQNAIRFCLSFEAVSTVIAGMMRVSDVKDDLDAAPLPLLGADQLRAVEMIYDAVFC